MSRLVVLAGPTAVGKGTVVRALRDMAPEVYVSVSATTRDPRPGEVDGVHYHFITREDFDRRIAAGEFLEHATVHGQNSYGTLRGPVDERLAQGESVLLEIDLQGARQVKQAMPDAHFVFLAPPSWEELVDRLVGRGTEGEEERGRRLATARQELAAVDEFDQVIVNDTVERAARELLSIVTR
ncbi:guanylate kinase [Demequina phytophila]|uniref:guanylate kinase n=1 Tax=Demequina phytophila TaxID=1638981 RepID=UPI000781518A|nr:guanylate kinase [Demequina phytophila]